MCVCVCGEGGGGRVGYLLVVTPVTQFILWLKPTAALLDVWSSPVREGSSACLKHAICDQVQSYFAQDEQRSEI